MTRHQFESITLFYNETELCGDKMIKETDIDSGDMLMMFVENAAPTVQERGGYLFRYRSGGIHETCPRKQLESGATPNRFGKNNAN